LNAVNSGGGAHRVHEADAVDRFALEPAGEVGAMPLWSHMAATFGAAGVRRGSRDEGQRRALAAADDGQLLLVEVVAREQIVDAARAAENDGAVILILDSSVFLCETAG